MKTNKQNRKYMYYDTGPHLDYFIKSLVLVNYIVLKFNSATEIITIEICI